MLKNSRQNLILVLALSSLFSLFLSFVRLYISGTILYLFLIWNLFLAWVPFICSSVLLKVVKEKEFPKVTIGILFFIWFIFFPNAPYIITDLFHLRIEQVIPIWFDVALIFSYVWNGLLVGFVSLVDMQGMLEKRIEKVYAWGVVYGVLILASFGIYIGRYLRWNSWDVFGHPLALFNDVTARIVNPFVFPRTYSMIIVFSLLLIISYSTFRFLIKNKHSCSVECIMHKSLKNENEFENE